MKLLSNIKQKMMCGINSISKTKILLSSGLVGGVTVIANTVFAQATLSGMLQGVYSVLGNVLQLVQYGAVVAAVVLAIMGIMTLKQASTAGQQGQQGQHKAGFVKIITAVALLIAVPLLQALQMQVAGSDSVNWEQGKDITTQRLSTTAQCDVSAIANPNWDGSTTTLGNDKAACMCMSTWGQAKDGKASAPTDKDYGGPDLKCLPYSPTGTA